MQEESGPPPVRDAKSDARGAAFVADAARTLPHACSTDPIATRRGVFHSVIGVQRGARAENLMAAGASYVVNDLIDPL